MINTKRAIHNSVFGDDRTYTKKVAQGLEVFDYSLTLENSFFNEDNVNNKEISKIQTIKTGAIDINEFCALSFGVFGENEKGKNQTQFFKKFLDKINDTPYVELTPEQNSYNTIYIKITKDQTTSILLMNSFIPPNGSNISNRIIRAFTYYYSDIFILFIDETQKHEHPLTRLLRDCYTKSQDKTIYVVHFFKIDKDEMIRIMENHYNKYVIINFNETCKEKFYYYVDKNDKNKSIIHLLYHDVKDESLLNDATFRLIKSVIRSTVQKSKKKKTNHKEDNFPFYFSQYYDFIINQLYTFPGLDQNTTVVEYSENKNDKIFKISATDSQKKRSSIINPNPLIYLGPRYYYTKEGDCIKLEIESIFKPGIIKGKVVGDKNQITLTFRKPETTDNDYYYAFLPEFIETWFLKIPLKVGIIKGYTKQYYKTEKINGRYVFRFKADAPTAGGNSDSD